MVNMEDVFGSAISGILNGSSHLPFFLGCHPFGIEEFGDHGISPLLPAPPDIAGLFVGSSGGRLTDNSLSGASPLEPPGHPVGTFQYVSGVVGMRAIPAVDRRASVNGHVVSSFAS